jgi:hypothetical protein
VPFSDLGSWAANNNYKPTAILQAMRQTGDDVLWLDADMELIAPLPEFARPADCWLHRPQAFAQVFDFTQGKLVPNNAGLRVPWGGHCAFANDHQWETNRIVRSWIWYCEHYTPATNDEQCLRRAIEALQLNRQITIAPFPDPASWLRHTPAGQQHGKPEAWRLV